LYYYYYYSNLYYIRLNKLILEKEVKINNLRKIVDKISINFEENFLNKSYDSNIVHHLELVIFLKNLFFY
jgi:hypothetical protein